MYIYIYIYTYIYTYIYMYIYDYSLIIYAYIYIQIYIYTYVCIPASPLLANKSHRVKTSLTTLGVVFLGRPYIDRLRLGIGLGYTRSSLPR
jgi:hypothetical protein